MVVEIVIAGCILMLIYGFKRFICAFVILNCFISGGYFFIIRCLVNGMPNIPMYPEVCVCPIEANYPTSDFLSKILPACLWMLELTQIINLLPFPVTERIFPWSSFGITVGVLLLNKPNIFLPL